MSFDLGNLLQGQLGNVLGQFLSTKGESAESSTKAAGLAAPTIIAALLKHVSGNPSNASGLIDLISGTAGSQLNNAVQQVGSEKGVESLLELGKNLLPNLLGGNAANVADQIAQESGVSKASAGSLVSLALPLVLSVLRGKAQSDNLSGGQVLGLLGQQQGWLSQALSGNMLSALGIGSLSGLFGSLSGLVGNLGSAGAATAAAAAGAVAAKKGGAGKWILLGLAALAALFALKNCGAGKDEQAAQAPMAASAASATSDVMASEASAPMAASAVASSEASAATASSEATPAAESATSETPATATSPAAATSADTTATATTATAAVEGDRVEVKDGVAKFYFATGSKVVAKGAEGVVADVIKAGQEGKKLIISGYADSTGNAASNEKLSKDRAEAVKAFFEAQGVKAENLELRKPEQTTGAQGNNVEGRRVEVSIEG